MKKNISNTDRLIRISFAAAVAFLYFSHLIQGVLAIVLGIAAVIIGATALFNFCPIYRALGISTKKNTQSYETRD